MMQKLKQFHFSRDCCITTDIQQYSFLIFIFFIIFRCCFKFKVMKITNFSLRHMLDPKILAHAASLQSFSINGQRARGEMNAKGIVRTVGACVSLV